MNKTKSDKNAMKWQNIFISSGTRADYRQKVVTFLNYTLVFSIGKFISVGWVFSAVDALPSAFRYLRCEWNDGRICKSISGQTLFHVSYFTCDIQLCVNDISK